MEFYFDMLIKSFKIKALFLHYFFIFYCNSEIMTSCLRQSLLWLADGLKGSWHNCRSLCGQVACQMENSHHASLRRVRRFIFFPRQSCKLQRGVGMQPVITALPPPPPPRLLPKTTAAPCCSACAPHSVGPWHKGGSGNQDQDLLSVLGPVASCDCQNNNNK